MRISHPARRRWIYTALLYLPVLLPYAGHLVVAAARGVEPTGFLHYEGRYYLANAREHFDAGAFRLTYSNPCSPDPDTPRIYVQPMSLLLGALMFVTAVDPGLLYALFGLLAAAVAIRLLVAVYEQLVGLESTGARMGLVLFAWGGGLLTLPGFLVALGHGTPVDADLIFGVDPFDGWWCLNLGRNLVLPTEALYHALALGALLCYLRGRGAIAIALLALLSASHPFTGLQLLTAAALFTGVQRYRRRNGSTAALLALAALLAAHVGYYLGFLPAASAEHRALVDRWSLPWTLNWVQILFAYGPVAGLAVARLRRARRGDSTFAVDSLARLLLAVFLVSFLLANHELVLDPIQPLHFTRGYIWTPLFLLGAPVLVRALDRVRRPVGLLFTGLLLLDNAAWIGWQTVAQSDALFLSRGDREALRWIDHHADPQSLLIAEDRNFAYSAVAYTAVRAWSSHIAVTPHAEDRQREVEAYFRDGAEPATWRARRRFVVRRHRSEAPAVEDVAKTATIPPWLITDLQEDETR